MRMWHSQKFCVITRAEKLRGIGHIPCRPDVSDLFWKSPVVPALGFALHVLSATATQLCHCSTKAAVGHRQVNECEGVIIKLYLQNQFVGSFSSMGCSLPTALLCATLKLPQRTFPWLSLTQVWEFWKMLVHRCNIASLFSCQSLQCCHDI